MRALELQELIGPDGFAIVERPDPEPGDRLLIEVQAAGVSFPDLLISQGRYQVKADLPYIAGQEVAGTVRHAPAGTRFAVGDRVWAGFGGGGFASVAAADEREVRPLPDGMSFVDGAGLSVNFMTAVFALRVRDRLAEGETILVLGAAGGLGTATVAVAKRYGARVIASVSSAGKAETARRAGADEVVVGEDWRDEVLALTGGRGVDVVADIVGGEHTLQAVRTCAPRGRVLILGFTTGSIASIGVNRLLLRNVSLVGAGLGALDDADPTTSPRVAELLAELLADGLRPLIGATFPLDRGADALRELQNRTAQGKIVLTL